MLRNRIESNVKARFILQERRMNQNDWQDFDAPSSVDGGTAIQEKIIQMYESCEKNPDSDFRIMLQTETVVAQADME